MKTHLLIVLCTLWGNILCARQTVNTDKPEGHKFYLDRLTNSKDAEYERVLSLYNAYIALHPADYLTSIERCRFIESAYNDGEYNPKYEEAEECREKLVEEFAYAPEVMIYQAESLWGDSVIPFCERAEEHYNQQPDKWPGNQIWLIYDKLADAYAENEDYEKAIHYADALLRHNDTIDRTLFLARQYNGLHNTKKATALLVSKLDSSNPSWELNQKGRLLLELGAPDKAIVAFKLAQKDSDSYQDAGALAQALIDNKLYKDARVYLVKEIEMSYGDNKTSAYQKLFDYDLKYSIPDSALASYQQLVEGDFMNDAIGINRFRLFIKGPLLTWSLKDLMRPLAALLCLLFLFAIPYIWILPIYYLGTYFKNRGMFVPDSGFRWGLKHLWILCSLMILVDIASTMVFNYGKLTVIETEVIEKVNETLAHMTIAHMVGLVLVTLLFFGRNDLPLIWGNLWEKRRSVGAGIALAFLLRFGLGIYLKIYQQFTGDESNPVSFMLVRNDILSVNQYYHPFIGFVFVVLLVPVYEEILFRGVFLSALEKNMRFVFANVLQSVVFASLHMDWKLAPFFFALGMVAGYYRNQTKSLAPGISLHITNNLLAFIAYMR